MSTEKEIIYAHCLSLLQQRVSDAQQAMNDAQKDANSETKSSAGDKYETGRAMAHLDKEMHSKRHATALNDLYLLQSIDPKQQTESIQLGSLVHSSQGIYFISVGLGSLDIDQQSYKVISTSAPVASILLGLEEGDEVDFRGRTIEILSVE